MGQSSSAMGQSASDASPTAPAASQFPLRRAAAMLLLPFSMLPVVLLAPSMVRAPAVLVEHVERFLAPAHHAPARPAPFEPWRYPVGASRLERDAFELVAGPLTPQVGVSPLAEHQTPQEKAQAPIVLLTGEPAIAGQRTATGEPVGGTGIHAAHGAGPIREDR